MPRFKRGTQYAAAPQLNHNRLWNTGSPGHPRSGRGQAPGDDVGERLTKNPANVNVPGASEQLRADEECAQRVGRLHRQDRVLGGALERLKGGIML